MYWGMKCEHLLLPPWEEVIPVFVHKITPLWMDFNEIFIQFHVDNEPRNSQETAHYILEGLGSNKDQGQFICS